MDSDKVKEAIMLAREYYRVPGNGAGGSLHLVLDDGNLFDSNVKFCINYASENGDAKGVELGERILKLTYSERKNLFKRHDEYAF